MKVRDTVETESPGLRARLTAAGSRGLKGGADQDGSKLYSFLLVEDHPLYAEGFRTAIRRTLPNTWLDVAITGQQAQAALGEQSYDLVFLDIQLPDTNGFHLLQLLQQRRIWQPVVILTGAVDAQVIDKARRAGALGVLSKRIDDTHLQRTCLRLLEGETWFEPAPHSDAPAPDDPDRLTARELDVLYKLAEGLENTQICRALGMSDSTLRTHLRALFQKLQVSNRTACVVKAIRLGVI